jgi:1-acyl-sn-glycerol-3-phosphate acyltransferase
MKLILSILFTPLFYLAFFVILLIFHPIQFIALKVFGRNAHDASVAALNYCIIHSHFIMGSRIKFINFKKIPQTQPLIIVANHQAVWDMPPLIWMFRKNHLKFIAKKELSKGIPSISYNLKHGGSVTINREDGSNAIKKIIKFAQQINKDNYAVCIFPEGSRSKDGKVKVFKSGGLKTLVKQMPNALVVPVAIKGTGELNNHGSKLLKFGVNLSYTFLEPVKINIKRIDAELDQIREDIKVIVEG